MSQQIRDLGRLVLQLHKKSPHIRTIDDCLVSSNWDDVTQAVRDVACYDEKTGKYKTPSLTLELGHSLSKCAGYMRFEGMKENDVVKINKGQRFIDLCTSGWVIICLSKSINHINNSKIEQTTTSTFGRGCHEAKLILGE